MRTSNKPAKTVKNLKKPKSGPFVELERTVKNRHEEP
jgi:hypothetical protein